MKRIPVFLLILISIACGRSSEKEIEILSKKIDSLEQEIRELKVANDTLSDHLLTKAYATRNYPPYFDSIPRPENFLLNKLRERPELIPKEPVLGGTMRFTSISFINDDFFVAAYEDGHVMGKAIYSYSLNRRGEIQFELETVIR